MAERLVYNRINGSQCVQDENGAWWIRYRKPGTTGYSHWAPHAGISKPTGVTRIGRTLNVTLPNDKATTHVP